jgi:hypothetical protein
VGDQEIGNQVGAKTERQERLRSRRGLRQERLRSRQGREAGERESQARQRGSK